MGAFNGLGPYNGHWNAREIPRASEPQSTKPEGFYVSYNHFFPVSGRVDETKGRWSITGKWFDKKREAEAFFKIKLSEGRNPVRWYKTKNDVSVELPTASSKEASMVLNTETIEVLYMRNGLGRFHLSAAPLQCEYDHCIHDFARAVEAEVRKQDDALIRQLVDALEPFAYEKPAREAVAAGRARLEGKEQTMTEQPTDNELQALWSDAVLPDTVTKRLAFSFARAVLAKWGIPAPVGVEPVAIYHGRCTIDCGEHGHLDMELLKMIPAGTKLYTAAQAKAAPDFYTVFARYEEEDGETGWIPLPGYSNETEHGVKNLVLEAARKEGYAGTAAGRLMELGWEIRPVYLAAAPAAPVREPLAAETIMKIVMDVEQQHHFFRGTTNWAVAVGRAIEFAHGITAPSGKRENK